MKLGVYSVLDKAVGAYLRPFYTRTKAEAIRSFSEACTAADNQFGKYPDDFLLCYHGEFDDNAGVFFPVEPVRIISARECVTAPS